MPVWSVVFVAAVPFAVLLAGLPWLAARARRSPPGGSPLTPFDEIWHPAAHRARVQIDVQVERVAPAPVPGDPPEAPRRSAPES